MLRGSDEQRACKLGILPRYATSVQMLVQMVGRGLLPTRLNEAYREQKAGPTATEDRRLSHECEKQRSFRYQCTIVG